MRLELSFLNLGRLDGRLTHSSARRAWMIRARFEGAAATAGNAGVPVNTSELEAWVAGGRSPPRASEGLNDPMSVAVVAHYFFDAIDASLPRADRATARLLHAMFDSGKEARVWGAGDLLRYGPLWRVLDRLARTPGLEPSLASVSARLAEMARIVCKSKGRAAVLATMPDGRQLDFIGSDPKGWVLWLFVPLLLWRAGLTANILPLLIPRNKLPLLRATEIEALLQECLVEAAWPALRSLDTLERRLAILCAKHRRSARSRLAEAAELKLVLPSLSRARLAAMLRATPAGAGYLLRQLDDCSNPTAAKV